MHGQIDWAAVRALWDVGIATTEITARTGAKRGTIHEHVCRHQWPKRGRIVAAQMWERKAQAMWEQGVYSTRIAEECGVADNTLCGVARRRGWKRPAGYNPKARPCHHPNPERYPDGSCIACRREKARARTPEYRREMRRIGRERKGKTYRTREQIVAERERRRLKREAARSARAEPIEAKCIAMLLAEDPSLASTLRPNTLKYRARYRFDPVFHAREIERLHKKKSLSNGHNLISDGSLDSQAIRTLYANAKSCLYCGQRMRSQDKSLDHIIPRCRGGWHSIKNVVICCRSCNSLKGRSMPDRWLMRVPESRRELIRSAWAKVQGTTDQLWLVA